MRRARVVTLSGPVVVSQDTFGIADQVEAERIVPFPFGLPGTQLQQAFAQRQAFVRFLQRARVIVGRLEGPGELVVHRGARALQLRIAAARGFQLVDQRPDRVQRVLDGRDVDPVGIAQALGDAPDQVVDRLAREP